MEDKSYSNGEYLNHGEDNAHGWQKVTYAKKQRKNQNKNGILDSSKPVNGGSGVQTENNSVFSGLEKHAEERRKKLEAQRTAAAVYVEDEFPRNNRRSHEDEDDFSSDGEKRNDVLEVNKKEKQKKVKKPKLSVAEAAAKIENDDLASFLSGISESYEGQQDIQLMRFADYFGRAFSAVSASQFPWLKLFRESPVAKIADVPVCYIPEAVCKTSMDWVNYRSNEALESFVIWSLDSIISDMAIQQPGSKVAKRGGQPASSKSQVAIFVVLAFVLRRKPDVLINVFPKLDENSKFQGHDKLPILMWMIVQSCQGNLAVGLYSWAHYILPILGGKPGSNPLTRDLVLQLVERILATPKARGILLSNAGRKGERLVPPAALNLLLHLTFPASSARLKATERFEAIYPVLKEIALSGSPGSKAMKQISVQIQSIAVKAAGEGIPELSDEAIRLFIWCLTQNPNCYKQWETLYVDNIEASAAALRRLAEDWRSVTSETSYAQQFEETLKSFRQKNEKELSNEANAARLSAFKDADRYCKILLGRLSKSRGWLKSIVITAVVAAAGVAAISPYIDSLDFSKISVLLNP